MPVDGLFVQSCVRVKSKRTKTEAAETTVTETLFL